MKKILFVIPLVVLASCSGRQDPADTVQDGTNAVIETIMARRSIRKYTDAKVEREKLEIIARCGINAPNGMNAQPWEVRIVDSPEFISGITGVYKKANPEMVARDKDFKNMFRNAPAIICIATKDGGSQIDAGLMAENMVLAAKSLGLGTCCLGGPVRFLSTDPGAASYMEKLGFSEGYVLTLVVAVGYPDESPEARPRDESKVKFIGDDELFATECLKAGEAAPDFTLRTIDGKDFTFSSLKGKTAVIDFWASWCPDCRKISPDIQRLAKEYSSKGVQFIGVSFDDSEDKWKEYVSAQGESPVIHVSELRKWKETDISKAYMINWIPTMYVVDKEGKVMLATVELDKLEATLKSL